MTPKETFNHFDLKMMPSNDRTRALNDEFIMMDNFYPDGTGDKFWDKTAMTTFIGAPYPFKIQFAMTLMLKRGSMKVLLNLREYDLGKNDILIVQSGDIGECKSMSEDCSIAVIALGKSIYAYDSLPKCSMMVLKYLATSQVLHLEDAQMQGVIKIYEEIREKLGDENFMFKKEFLQGCLVVLISLCCQFIAPYVSLRESEKGSRKQQIFEQFMTLLKEHYRSERQINFYADKMCITPKYLSQMILGATGRLAGAWIRDYVCLEAKALLKCHQYSVAQISEMLNFPSQSFFGTYFKKGVGCSPLEYRKM